MAELAVAPSITDLVTAKDIDTDALMAALGQKDLSSSKTGEGGGAFYLALPLNITLKTTREKPFLVDSGVSKMRVGILCIQKQLFFAHFFVDICIVCGIRANKTIRQ